MKYLGGFKWNNFVQYTMDNQYISVPWQFIKEMLEIEFL